MQKPATQEQLSELSQEEILQKIKEKVNKIRSYTPKVGVFGNSGVGKSSLCNALFGKEVAKIADVEACTREPQEILLGSKNGGIILIDVPGIGEDPTHQKQYTDLYKKLAPELDLVLWAIKADDRNYASGMEAYREIFNSEQAPPVLFVITQTDKTNDIEDWDHTTYKPDGIQLANISLKEHDVSKRFDISTRKIISVAVSKKGRSYNLSELVSLVVEALPNEKKYAFTREAKDENVSEKARENAEKGIWDSVKEFVGNAWDTVKEKAADIIVESASKLLSKAFNVTSSFFKRFF